MSQPANAPIEKHFGSEPFPRKPLFAAFALVAMTLAGVTAARLSHVGTPAVADPAADIAVARDLRFEDQADGSIRVEDAGTGMLVSTLAPGSNNFIRGTLRALVRERHRDSLGREQPFRLIARHDGHLLLNDPATQRVIDLGSFGPTNAAAFAQLLRAPETPAADGPRLAAVHP